MSASTHHLRPLTGSSGEEIFECEAPSCGRRIVFNGERRELVILDRGDPSATHEWQFPGVALRGAIQD